MPWVLFDVSRSPRNECAARLRTACAPWLRVLVPRRPPPRPSLRSPCATRRSNPSPTKLRAPGPQRSAQRPISNPSARPTPPRTHRARPSALRYPPHLSRWLLCGPPANPRPRLLRTVRSLRSFTGSAYAVLRLQAAGFQASASVMRSMSRVHRAGTALGARHPPRKKCGPQWLPPPALLTGTPPCTVLARHVSAIMPCALRASMQVH